VIEGICTWPIYSQHFAIKHLREAVVEAKTVLAIS